MNDFLKSLYMFKNDGISIVITAYKAQDFIEECLDSIQNQTYFEYNDNYEILLGIDACESTLNKANEIRGKYKNLRIFYASENGGTYRMRNSLWIKANYENILFFDSDDVLSNEFLSLTLKQMNFCDLERFYLRKFTNTPKKENLENTTSLAHGQIIVKKSVLNHVGGFYDERIGMDTDLINRIFKLNYRIYENKNAVFYYRVSSNQLTSNPKTNFKSKYRREISKLVNKRISDKEYINDKIVINESLKMI